MCFYSDTLEKMLSTAHLIQKSAYTTGDVSKLLNVSNSMVIVLCDEWVPPSKVGSNPKGLECYRVGTHRRIPHHAIVEWLQINSNYNKASR